MAPVLKSSSEIVDQNSILADWCGARVEIWIFHLTFRRLALLLRVPQRSEVLYVVCLGCRHIAGPFGWRDAKLAISDGVQSGEENCKRVYDQNGQFELICDGGVVLFQCAEIVNSFEDFRFPA
jgi:hypothetical protein